MSQARHDAALPEAKVSVGERVSERLRGLLGRVERAGGSIAAGAAKGRGKAARAAEGLRRSTPLRHGLAAGDRGNLEAALALLREAVALAPDDGEAVLALWNVALACEQPAVAAEGMARWIHGEASSGRRDLAAEHWIELSERVPEQRVDVPTLVRLLPELRRRVAEAHGAEARTHAEACLRRALRECVAPDAPELTTGLALRIFEQARFLDAETARRAGAIVLAATDLHETKRQHVETLLAQLDAESQAEAPVPPLRKIIEVTPVELAENGLIVRQNASGQRTRIDLRAVEAIATARVGADGEEPAVLVDLLLRRAAQARERRVVRMRTDAFDPAAVLSDRSGGEDALGDLLGALLDRSGAVPLPDPDSALGTRPRAFASLEDYEREVLGEA